jgi:pimeloyl-ACP methyl ester carboxylesterase
MAAIRTSHVEIDGVRSRVYESGSADSAEAVVFVHGNPGSGADWRDLLARVGGFARAIAPDMPGFGAADRPSAFAYTIEGYAAHLGALLERLGITRAHLVLHDFGGPWGLVWAARHPEAVASVTLINTGIMPGYRWHKYARIWRTPILGELFLLSVTRRSLRWLLDRENPKPMPQSFIDRLYADLDRGNKRALLRLYRATDDIGAMSEAWGQRLAPHRLPALVLWGTTGDNMLPPRYAEAQRAYFGEVAVHLLAGCGHWPFVDDPERTAALIVPFLQSRTSDVSWTGGRAGSVLR